MSRKDRARGQESDGSRFIRLPFVVIDSPAYRAVSHPARSLLLDIARQFSGHNNGKLVACAKYLRPLGWKSNDTVSRALRELVEARLLIETRKGRRPNTAAWFAMAWWDLQIGDGLDIDPKSYRRGEYLRAVVAPSGGVEEARIDP